MRDLLSLEKFLTDSMSLKIRANLSFKTPVTRVFMRFYLEDTEGFANNLYIRIRDLYFETTLFGVEGRLGYELKLVITPPFDVSEVEYRVFIEISRLDFF